MLESFFLFGITWRGRSWMSYFALIVCVLIGDAVSTSISGEEYHVGFSHMVALGCGLVASLAANFISAQTGRDRNPTFIPSLIIPVVVIAGDFFLPSGVEGSFLFLVLVGALLAIHMMMTEIWDPVIVHISAGLLLAGSLFNFLLRDSYHCDGVRLWWWSDTHTSSDPGYVDCLNQLVEATVVITGCLIGGVVSIPLIISGSLWVSKHYDPRSALPHEEPEISAKSRTSPPPQFQKPRSGGPDALTAFRQRNNGAGSFNKKTPFTPSPQPITRMEGKTVSPIQPISPDELSIAQAVLFVSGNDNKEDTIMVESRQENAERPVFKMEDIVSDIKRQIKGL